MKLEKIDLRDFAPELPPIIARDHVEKLLGGIISAKTLANLDSLGLGPKARFRVGRKIAYITKDLLEWLAQKAVRLN